MSKNLSTTLAMSAAALFLMACNKGGADTANPGADAAGGDTNVKCMGINECKGEGKCETATHSCAGQNECKGKGWLLVSASECEAQGGEPKA